MNDEIVQHYNLEVVLANILRNAKKEDRKHLYTSLYDQLYKEVPSLIQKINIKSKEYELRFLKQFIKPEKSFLEIGPGNCYISLAISKKAKEVFAVDVCNEITNNIIAPENFKLIISDGCNIDVPNNSIDIIYSNQLMEHLHPDDVIDQLQNIYNALKINGKYICRTPNSLSGPHDISKYFDKIAKGFHLKEYTYIELNKLFKDAGFKKNEAYIVIQGYSIKVPLFLFIIIENILQILPYGFRKAPVIKLIIKKLLGINIVGIK